MFIKELVSPALNFSTYEMRNSLGVIIFYLLISLRLDINEFPAAAAFFQTAIRTFFS
jgi:hypothetical protein